MTPRLLLGYTCGMMCFVSCSQPTTTQRSADVRTTPLKKRIPTADPIKYRSVRDARGWQNPYLIVKATGIDILPIGADKNAQTTSPVGVVGYLEKLRCMALWPCLAVQEAGLRNPGDDNQIKRNRDEVVRILRDAGVVVVLWPTG
jgi:hypothetical protein